MSYYGNFDRELLEIIPLDAGSVLEFGGGNGALATAYQERNPTVRYVAVDAIDDAAATDGAPFDVIVMATQATAPERTLAGLHALLADDGHLAIGLPEPSQSGATLFEALIKAGFRIIKTRSPGSPSAVLAGKAERAAVMPVQIVMAVFSPILMAARTKLPAAALATLPDIEITYSERVIDLPRLPAEQPKVLIIQRMLPMNVQQWIDIVVAAIRRNYLVVSELDDHPDLCRQVLVGRGERDPWWTIEIAHAVQTSTEPLAAAMRARNPEVRALPNAALALPLLPARTSDRPTIFYGACNRERFSAQVAQALAPAIADHPKAFFDVVRDRAFFDSLPTTNKRFRSGLEYDDYLAALAESDIALSPLEGRPAELFKSDIKYVEAASRGSAMIASPQVYAETIVDGQTGLIARTLDDWAPALDRLLRDPALRAAIAARAWADIRDHRMFGPQAARQRDWYRDLWARRAELDAALRARVPAIDAALREQP